jgi:hypothetical protein
MRNTLDTFCRENQNMYFMSSNFSENHAVYEIMSKNIVDREGPQIVTIWRMRLEYWISKGTSTHAQAAAHASRHPHARSQKHTHAHTNKYIILIAFTQQK